MRAGRIWWGSAVPQEASAVWPATHGLVNFLAGSQKQLASLKPLTHFSQRLQSDKLAPTPSQFACGSCPPSSSFLSFQRKPWERFLGFSFLCLHYLFIEVLMVYSLWRINLSNWVSRTLGCFFSMTQPGPESPKPVRRVERTGQKCVWGCFVLNTLKAKTGEFWFPPIFLVFPLYHHSLSKTDCLFACFLVCHSSSLHGGFSFQECFALQGSAIFHRVDTVLMLTEGRVSCLTIQEREKPGKLRREQLGKVIGPQGSKWNFQWANAR